MNEFLIQIILAVIAVLGALISSVLIPFIKAKTTNTQQDMIQTLVKLAVQSAEQIFNRTGSGVDKKAYVLSILRAKGLPVDEAQLDIIVEAFVYQMNRMKMLPMG